MWMLIRVLFGVNSGVNSGDKSGKHRTYRRTTISLALSRPSAAGKRIAEQALRGNEGDREAGQRASINVLLTMAAKPPRR